MADSGRNKYFHDINDLFALYEMASEFASSDGCTSNFDLTSNGFSDDYAPCRWFYRNKSPQYFEEIQHRCGGMMEVELKDASGDPRSPINGIVSGMFFMASVEAGSRTGEPMRCSPFGPWRVLVPVKDMLDTAPNLYFTDFYCMTSRNYHYVTLVMTVPGSKADQFCDEFLFDLDIDNNPFLIKDRYGQLQVTTKERLLVEVFYTEDLDIVNYEMKYDIPVVGKGMSTPGGIPKNRHCKICNLQP